MKSTPFILGINGSPFINGNVSHLLKLVLGGAKKEGAEIKIINLYSLKIRHEQGFYSKSPKKAIIKNMLKDDMKKLVPDILRADGIVFATPVYWANMSGAMKDFIDRLTPFENDGYRLEGKIAAIIASSKENEGGRHSAAMSLASPLLQMGFMLPPLSVMWYPGKWSTSNKKIKSWGEEDAPKVGKNMVCLIKLLRQNKIRWSK